MCTPRTRAGRTGSSTSARQHLRIYDHHFGSFAGTCGGSVCVRDVTLSARELNSWRGYSCPGGWIRLQYQPNGRRGEVADVGENAVLVTGAAGFGGSHLVRQLLACGHRIPAGGGEKRRWGPEDALRRFRQRDRPAAWVASVHPAVSDRHSAAGTRCRLTFPSSGCRCRRPTAYCADGPAHPVPWGSYAPSRAGHRGNGDRSSCRRRCPAG